MKRLEVWYNNCHIYNAGIPLFQRNFSRDSIIAGILAEDPVLLKNQLRFCAIRQGKTKNPYNGEEPGKVHHEYPPAVTRPGLSTEFNACDTTGLSLIGYEEYERLTNDKDLKKARKPQIEKGLNYILSHLKNDLFIESPEFCGAKRFSLKVTYWKDSEILARKQGEPDYPVVYPLAHIINMRALQSAAKLLDSKELEKIADRMVSVLEKLYDWELGAFYIAIDKTGPIRGISSDSLHALAYLSPGDLSEIQLKQIVETSAALETPLGYRTLDPKSALLAKDGYHADTVWPWEQAIINSGARKFGLKRVMEVSARITPWLADSDSELFFVKGENVRKVGCNPQLWTIAAKKYFLKHRFWMF